MTTDPLLTTAEVAAWLNVSQRYVRKLAENGMIDFMRLHSRGGEAKPIYRFSRQAVAKYLGVDVPTCQPSPRECEVESAIATARLTERLRMLRARRRSSGTSEPSRKRNAQAVHK